MGDAAHVVHPLAGQGVNLGFRDAQALATILAQRQSDMDLGDYMLLRRYERARKEDILKFQFVTDGLKKLFNNTYPGLETLRNFGLKLTDHMPHIKKVLVQHALN